MTELCKLPLYYKCFSKNTSVKKKKESTFIAETIRLQNPANNTR